MASPSAAAVDAEGKLTTRIRQLVAGEGHTLALTDSGHVYSWGKGSFGRLGAGGTMNDQSTPVGVAVGGHHTRRDAASESFFPTVEEEGNEAMHSKVIDIAAGAYHSVALTEDGAVWCWGYGAYGQLGQDNTGDSCVPLPVSRHHVEDKDERSISIGAMQHVDKHYELSKVVTVWAGGMISCAIDEGGLLWMWGNCPISPHKDKEELIFASYSIPQPVAGLQGLTVVEVACGSEHVLAMVTRGPGKELTACYTWGGNKFGQLGTGDRNSRGHPYHVQVLDVEYAGTLTAVACGAYHSAVLTSTKAWSVDSNDYRSGNKEAQVQAGEFWATLRKRKSICWTFGLGDNGQLGHGDTQSLDLPKIIEELPENEGILALSCGLFHMGVLTETGEVWTWGMEMGLGLCPGIGPPGTGAGDFLLPVRVAGDHAFDGLHGEKLACGAGHTVLVVNDGSTLWAWGRGQSGVLGTGCATNSLTPAAVVWPPALAHGSESKGTSHGLASLGGSVVQDVTFEGEANKKDLLALAQEEICTLTTKLADANRSAALFHAALYGLPESSNLLQEWRKMVEGSSYDDLLRLDSFYHGMRSHVKEVLLGRKVEMLCQEVLSRTESRVNNQASNDRLG